MLTRHSADQSTGPSAGGRGGSHLQATGRERRVYWTPRSGEHGGSSPARFRLPAERAFPGRGNRSSGRSAFSDRSAPVSGRGGSVKGRTGAGESATGARTE